MSDFFSSKSIGLMLLMRWTNCVSFTKTRQKCRFYPVNKKGKKKANGRTDGQQKPRHDISSAGFQNAPNQQFLILKKKKEKSLVLVYQTRTMFVFPSSTKFYSVATGSNLFQKYIRVDLMGYFLSVSRIFLQ